MSTQIVQHKSRDFDVVLNFPVTENTLSWAFTAENDGEIYAVDLVNVASYQIASAPVTLPYAVTAGTSYSVTIVKQTNGLPATISFNTRRAVNKAVSISVPDFGQYSGRYLYVLKNNNVIEKYDSQLLLPSNYAGAGTWTTSPLVATIVLPTLPNSAVYTSIIFVKNNNQEKIFIVGGEANSFRWYASYIRISDDAVYNLDFTTHNGYTQIFNGAQIYNSPKNIIYDYISDFIYIKSAEGSHGTSVLKLDLNTLLSTNLGYSSFADGYLNEDYINQYQFSPIDMQFVSVGDSSLINNRNYNYKVAYNNGSKWAYRFRNNTRLCTGDVFGYVQEFNSEGVRIAGYYYGALENLSCTEIKCFDRANVVIMAHVDFYAIVNFGAKSAKLRQTDLELAAPNIYLTNLQNSHYSNIYFAFCANAYLVLSNRMIVLKEDQPNADFGYLDFSTTIYGACTNQLIV